jgi:rRNA-processing protein FCF1
MRYVTDAQLSGLAEELRKRKVDCQTVHKLILGHEDSSKSISDPDILRFLVSEHGGVTLITADNELAEYCSKFDVPVIRVQDLVVQHVLAAEQD